MENPACFELNKKKTCLIGIVLIATFLGVNAQRTYNVNVRVAPPPANWCFGSNFTPAYISIAEQKNNGFGTTTKGDSNKVIIYAPSGFRFASGEPTVVLKPSTNDFYITQPQHKTKNNSTNIVLSFKTWRSSNVDSIALTGITLIPQTLKIGVNYGQQIRVTYDSVPAHDNDVDTTYYFKDYIMQTPTIVLSRVVTDSVYCEYDDSVQFNVNISENTGGSCGYDTVYLVGHHNDGSYDFIEKYFKVTGSYSASEIEALSIATTNLNDEYQGVLLALRKNRAIKYSNELPVGNKEDGVKDTIEFLHFENEFEFEQKSINIGVNSGSLFLYNMFNTKITESNFDKFANDAERLFIDENNSTYLVIDKDNPILDPKDDVVFRFEFPDDKGEYQATLDNYGYYYLHYGCTGGSFMYPCPYITRSAYYASRYFDPTDSWVDYSNPNVLLYNELHHFDKYDRYCSFIDEAEINVIPEEINVPGELCASDGSDYKIRIDTTKPEGFPETVVFYGFKVTIKGQEKEYTKNDADSSDKQAVYFNFNPQKYFEDNTNDGDELLLVTISSLGEYADSPGKTIRYYEKTIRIYTTNTEDLDLLGYEQSVCYDPADSFRITSNYTLDSLKGAAIRNYYSGAAVDWYLRPSVAYDQSNTQTEQVTDSIEVFFKDMNGCPGKDSRYYVIKPAPQAKFTSSFLCINNYILFNSDSSKHGTGDTLKIYEWNFGDGTTYVSDPNSSDTIPHSFDNGSTIGTTQIPRHKYSTSGNYDVTLKLETTAGCEDTAKKTIRVEDIPDPGFEYSHTGLEQNKVEYTNTSVSGFALGYTYFWDFDDGHYDITDTLSDSPQNTYMQTGIFDVTLKAVTTNGCSNSFTQKVPVFPFVEVTDNNHAFYTFSEGDGWYASHQFDKGKPSGWELEPVSGIWTDDKHYNGEMWVTGKPENEVNNETGWIESPCFDFRELSFPMLSVDIFQSLEPGRDGAVVQYTVDDGENWSLLGEIGIGANWYNKEGIYSSPGNNDEGENEYSQGWSSDTTAWLTARYPLDNIKTESQKAGSCVRFRIAYNSNDYHDTAYAGFAVDNFLIGKRKRIVLLEQFINSTYEEANPSFKGVNFDLLNSFVDYHPKEVVDIRYHMACSYLEDPLFYTFNNWWDNSARAWEYGAESFGPMWAMDGEAILSNIWGVPQEITYEGALEQRALVDPVFEIDSVVTELDGGSVHISARITKISASLDEKLGEHDHKVRFAIVQKEYINKDGQTHRNVLVDLLPNGVGNVAATFYAPYPVGSVATVTETWSPSIKTTGNDFRLIIYVQGRYNYQEIEQVWFRDLDDNEVPQFSTGIGELPISANSFAIYPNPVSDKVYISMPEGFGDGTAWSIYNINGQIMGSGHFFGSNAEESIDAEALKDGFYILKLINKDGQIVTGKFSKNQ